jgi:cation:H+ antiporter
MGLGALISSKVNQWTLLVGGVPLAYAVSSAVHGHGFAPCLVLDAHMESELWLTAAQGLYAIATIADLDFSLRQALTILGLFLVQFTVTLLMGTGLLAGIGYGPERVAPFHLWVAGVYGALALFRITVERRHLVQRLRDVRHGVPAAPDTPLSDRCDAPDEQDA